MTNNKQRGFTLTELMLAMAFISFMLVFIMTAIVQMTRIYNKGLSIRQMNQAGRQFSEDFTRTAKYAPAGSILQDAAKQRICVNGVTYAWNTQDPTVSPKNIYVVGSTKPIVLVKVSDPGGALCTSPLSDIPLSATDMLPDGLNVQRITLSLNTADGKVAVLHSLVSTGGSSAPVYKGAGAFDYQCPSGLDGAFCAIAEFETTAYVRN